MIPTLILCLGNEILSDDAFGFRIANMLKQNGGLGEGTEVVYASLAGFNLLGILENRERALIVDTILTGNAEPGTIHFFHHGYFAPSLNLVSSHEVSLPAALKLGGLLGLNLPGTLDVLAVEAADVSTLSEQLTPPVESALQPAVERIKDWLDGKQEPIPCEEKYA